MSSQMKLVGVHRRVATLPAPHALESSTRSSTALELHAHGPVSATRRFLRLLLRAASLGLLLLPPLLLLLPVLFLDDANGSWQARFERALLGALERGGPCLTKLGQWASTRPDVLPPSLCATLSSLHHRVRPHSLAHTRAAIAEAFGVPSEELFGELSAEPVGSGCIAQAIVMHGWKLEYKLRVCDRSKGDFYATELSSGVVVRSLLALRRRLGIAADDNEQSASPASGKRGSRCKGTRYPSATSTSRRTPRGPTTPRKRSGGR